MPTDFKCCACGICETDCEYHKPTGVISEETISGTEISFTNLLKQMYPQKDLEGAFFFGSGSYASRWTGLKAWIPAEPPKDGESYFGVKRSQ